MGNENLNQFEGKERIEPTIRTSRDGKWIIIRVPGVEQPIIKAVAYFEAIIRRAKNRTDDSTVNTEKIKA